MVHQGFVLEFAVEATRIANAIPRLDADEGCLLVVGTPEGNDGGAEGDCDLGLSCLVQQFCAMQLALVNLDGVVAPGVVGELHQSVFGFYERYLVHIVRTIEIAVEGIHRLFVVETDATALAFAWFHVRDVEGGMTAYLEVNLAGVRVVDVPDDANLVVIEHVADAEGEVVWIDLLRLLRGLQHKGHLALTLGHEFELGIAGKAVTRQVILLAVHTIGFVIDAADDGKKDG